ncbi:MAG: nuclear transport factor 2 family protein, partial [Steroidobacteraceae bacterium]
MKNIIRSLAALACVAIASVAIAQTQTAMPVAAAPPAPDLGPRLTRVADRIAAIDAEANRIDDYNQLRNLQQMYGFYFDEALWDQVVDLFADDATVEVGLNGVYVGKDSIRRYYLGMTAGKVGLVRGQLN